MSYLEHLTVQGCKIAAEYWDNYVVLSGDCEHAISFEHEYSFNAGRYNEIKINGLQGLADYAFHDLRHVRKVFLNDTIKVMGKHVFSYCNLLQDVRLPTGITTLPEETFIGCNKLETIVLPDNITKIERQAFRDCSRLRKITFPSNLQYIEGSAFLNCKNLASIDLPSSLRSIGESAFKNTGLTDITLPESITEFGDELFRDCQKLQTVNFTSSGNVSISMFHNCQSLAYVFLSKTQMQISSNAFKECKKIVRIRLPEGLKVIKSFAFEDCENLESIEIPENVEIIDPNFAKKCRKVKSITVHPRNQHFIIHQNALFTSDFKRLILYPPLCQERNFSIPEEVSSFDDNVFSSVTYLRTVILPTHINFISIKHAFIDCTSLETIIYEGTEEIRDNLFYFLKGRVTRVYAPYAYPKETLGGLVITERTGQKLPDRTPTPLKVVKKNYKPIYVAASITFVLMISIIIFVIKVTTVQVKKPDAFAN